jgi:nucleoside-diphosphate-sugar epimerase
VDLVLNNLVAYALTTGTVHMLSDGTPWRPIVHVEDISRAFLAVLEADREVVHDEAFNVGRTDENYRIRELAEIVADTVPDTEITYEPGAGPDARCYRVTCEKIRRTLPGLDFAWDARRGAAQLHDAYQRAGLTLEEFQGSRYIRLKRIRELLESGEIGTDLRWVG